MLIAKRNVCFSDGSRETFTDFLGQLKNISYEDAKQICGFAGYALSALPLTEKHIHTLRLMDSKRQFALRVKALNPSPAEDAR